jgi:hypothetical protein
LCATLASKKAEKGLRLKALSFFLPVDVANER